MGPLDKRAAVFTLLVAAIALGVLYAASPGLRENKTKRTFRLEARSATMIAMDWQGALPVSQIEHCLTHPQIGGVHMRGPVRFNDGSSAVFSQARHLIIHMYTDGERTRVVAARRPQDAFTDDARQAVTRCLN